MGGKSVGSWASRLLIAVTCLKDPELDLAAASALVEGHPDEAFRPLLAHHNFLGLMRKLPNFQEKLQSVLDDAEDPLRPEAARASLELSYALAGLSRP